jgi:hypothetical protein
MTTRRSWIEDYCEDGNMPADKQHAIGLTKLHESCEPPCPRMLVAQRYLRERCAGGDPGSTASDG